MNYYTGFKKININKIWYVYLDLLLFFSILFSRNTLINSCVIGFKQSFFLLLILYLPLIIVFFIGLLKRKIDMSNKKEIIIMLVIMVIEILIKRDWQLINFSILYYIFINTILISIMDRNRLIQCYIKILIFLSIFSILTTYIVKPIIFRLNLESQILNTNLIVKNSVNYNFLNLFFGFALFSKTYDRNYGIFTEPSFFQFYLIIAIIMVLFSKDKRKINWIKIGILAITVYTTKAAGGFVALALIVATYLLKYIIENRNNYKKICKMLIGISIIIIVLLHIPNINKSINFVYGKLTSQNASSISRFGSIEYTITKFLDSPIIGNKITDILHYENNLTNTIFSIGAIYGIIPFICVIYFMVKFTMKFKQNKIISFCIFIIIILSSNTHFFVGVQSFWMLILLGLGEDKNEDTLDS